MQEYGRMTFLTTLWLLTNAGDDDRGIKKNGHERSIRTNCGSALLGGETPVDRSSTVKVRNMYRYLQEPIHH